jgi:hypothetical protein
MKCEHEDFEVYAVVNRISKDEGGPISHYNAEIKVRCRHCETLFEFVGLPLGVSPYRPTVSMDGFEMRVPITPMGVPVPKGLPEMSVKMSGVKQ